MWAVATTTMKIPACITAMPDITAPNGADSSPPMTLPTWIPPPSTA